MAKTKLNINKDFIVRESIGINLVAGIILVVVFFVSIAIADFGWANFLQGAILLLMPGAFYLARARKNATIIKINKSGIYYAGKLLTNWTNFIDAVVTQDDVVGSIEDNFILVVRYYDEQLIVNSIKIPLSNTQDKAEEEVIEAINFYYKSGKDPVTSAS